MDDQDPLPNEDISVIDENKSQDTTANEFITISVTNEHGKSIKKQHSNNSNRYVLCNIEKKIKPKLFHLNIQKDILFIIMSSCVEKQHELKVSLVFSNDICRKCLLFVVFNRIVAKLKKTYVRCILYVIYSFQRGTIC